MSNGVDSHRSAVLIVTRNLPPLVGGMERLGFHVIEELARGFRVSVIGPVGCQVPLSGFASATEVPVRPLWKFFAQSLWRALNIAVRERPLLLFAGSGLTAPITWLAARLTGARCAVYLHGLDMIAPSAVYRRLWLPLIRRHDLCIVNSQYSRSLALEAGLRDESISVLNPGVSLPSDRSESPSNFRREFGVERGRMLLYVGRLTPRKGLLEFIQQGMPRLLEDEADLKLVVIGEEAKDAIGNTGIGYLSRVKSAAEQLGLEQAVHYLGTCPDQTLEAAYQAADVLVFPAVNRPGDVEGFGMVAIEAAAHGTPTVAFAVGGIPDAVRDGVSGTLVPEGDYSAFTRAIQRAWSDYANPAARERCRAFAAGYRWEAFGARLRHLICHMHGAPG